MSDDAKRTPGPLTYFVGNANGRGLVRIETAIDAPIAGLHIASLTRDREADAARLVLAANCHDDLLAACKALLAAPWDIGMHDHGQRDDGARITHRFDGDGAATGCGWCVAKAMASAAITKASGR